MTSALTPATPAPAPARDSSVSSSSTVGGRQKQFPNGLRGKPTKSQSDKETDALTPDQHSHDRLLFLLAHCVGFPVTLAVQSGHKYSGIFSGASLDSPDNAFVLKMAKKIQDATGAALPDDEPYTGHGEDHVLVFARDDMVDLHATGVTFDKNQRTQTNGSAAAFRTDTDISGNRSLKERELQPWQPSGDTAADLTFSSNGNASWDQFEVNQRLYGVKTDYDEAMYTTQIDRSAPSYKERAAVADRLAREIEGAAGGSHQAREDANDLDEEARFSGVQRDPQPLAPSSSSSANRYTLPARRAPTGQPTVSGAPVDPAIISAQLARPDSVRTKTNATPPPSTQKFDSSKKENVPATSAETPAQETGKARDLTPIHPTAAPGPSRSPNATETVTTDVLKSFRDFSAGEKIKVQAHQRALIKRDKEVKLNDLKKFAANFKLPRPVPEDMLGILAKDKRKQEEIMKKSQTEAEAKKSPTKIPDQVAQEASSSAQPKPAVPTARVTGEVAAPVPIPVEPASQRGRGHGPRNSTSGRNDKGPYNNNNNNNMGAGRGMPPGTFGARKMREYGNGQAPSQPMVPPTGPAAQQADAPINRAAHAPTPSSTASSRFNVGALEFRPNPTASTFSPSLNASSVTSQSGSRPVSKAHSPTKKSFFEGQRPGPASEQRSIRDGFNPVKRMRAEAQAEGKAKDFAQNDGIPPSFTTRPTWDTTKENEEKGYMDMFDKANMPAPPTMPGMMAHQHQLPPHLQQGMHAGPHFQGPQHTARFPQSPMHHGQREHYFEDNRMQYSTSQPGMYGSPRAQPGMMMQHSPMSGAAQPVYMPPQPVYVGGQPMVPYNAGGRPGQMPPQMMGQPGMHPQGGQFMVPAQPGQMMYSPGPGQMYPAPTGPQGSGGYPSPRPPPMMAPQGSQQGHAPQMMYPSGSQQGHPVYFMPQQQNQPMGQMRGGYPMQQQGSFNASPHMQYQYPMQPPRGPQQYGSYPQQHMQPMHPQPPPSGSDMK